MTPRQMMQIVLFLAMTTTLSASIFSLSVPGGHLYLNGIIIYLTALLFSPFQAAFIAGVGSFLGDFFFYPAAMWVSFVVHGLQAYVIARSLSSKEEPYTKFQIGLAIGMGALVDMIGFYIGRSFIYATPSQALLKIPFDSLQLCVGISGALLIYGNPTFQKIWQSSRRI